MKIKKISDTWGDIIEFDNPKDFFQKDLDYWRNKIYERQLLVFKQLKFSKEEYYKFCCYFGSPWKFNDYNYSRELKETVVINKMNFAISHISNVSCRRLGTSEMAWHADIPNRSIRPYPFRTIWMVKNPNPNAGFTNFLNIQEGLDFLPTELKEKIPEIKIIQQSWYEEGTDIKEFDFIKTHPITGKKSLRLNFFCVKEENITDAWIRSIKINDEITDNIKPILGPYIKHLTNQKELFYKHQWDTFDLLIYDNWSLLHNREELDLKDGEERKMYRTNIDHLSDIEWTSHKKLLKTVLK